MPPYLGMYVHMHWGYRYPYSARTWRLDDWRRYAGGLAGLGYNLILIWPMLETLPEIPTDTDRAHLEKMRQVIDLLHDELGMTVGITLGPNTVGNDRAADWPFEQRPFFAADRRLDPGDPAAVQHLLAVRRQQLAYLAQADLFAIIDGDPGGWIGSTNDQFADLLVRHLDLFGELNPQSRLFYWMWTGWEPYNRMWQGVQAGRPARIDTTAADFRAVLDRLAACPAERWGVFSCWGVHQQVVDELGLADRALFFPYGAVEGEPTFPLTGYRPADLARSLAAYDPARTRLGVMANAQTHVVQLPHTHLFACLAKVGSLATADLAAFGDSLLPGRGSMLAVAWQALAGDDAQTMRGVADWLAAAPPAVELGPAAGLLLGGADRFLGDLGLQLRFRADAVDFQAAVAEGRDRRPALHSLTTSWGAWQRQTGFADACADVAGLWQPLRSLGNPGVNAILDAFDDWANPPARHGLVPKLLAAMARV